MPFVKVLWEAHLYLSLIFLFSMFVLAKFNGYTKGSSVLFYETMILPALLLFFVTIMTNLLSVYEIIFISEAIFYVVLSFYIFSKRNIDIRLTLAFLCILSIAIYFTKAFTYLASINLIWLAVFHIASIILFMVVSNRTEGQDNVGKINLINAIASIVIVFMYTQDGLFFALAIKLIFFIALFKELLNICKRSQDEIKRRYELLEKDFREEVRKEVKTQIFYMEMSQNKMAEIAKMDDLTKIYNKKTILNALSDSISNQKDKTFSLLIFDIDKFKQVNDTLGHIQGDKCIKELAMLAQECMRDGDMVGRYGGDEFFALIKGAELETAVVVAERLRKKVEATKSPHYTISIGIANYPKDAENVKDLIKYADDGLYIAKGKGRNALGYLSKSKNNS